MSNISDNYSIVRYIANIENTFTDINSSINHFLTLSSNKTATHEYTKLKKYLDNILVDLQKKEQQIASSLEICEKYNNNILEDAKDCDITEFVKKSKNGNLFYNEINEKNNLVQKININEIGYSLNMSNKEHLNEVPDMFYWYSDGVYCCPFPGLYIKVPFVEVVNTLRDTPKNRTVRCSYKTKELCDKYSKDKKCTFAHKGDSYVKISPYARCPKNPTFGDKISIVHDLTYLKEEDIRLIAMYGLSDLILVHLWYNMKKWNGTKIINDIEKCV